MQASAPAHGPWWEGSRPFLTAQELKTGRRFTRSVALLAPWRGEIPEEAEPAKAAHSLVGKLVVTVDNIGEDTYSLARVLLA